MKEFREKLHHLANVTNVLCDVLELIVALLVTIGICIALCMMVPSAVTELLHMGHDMHAFTEYLEGLFSIVIGIEFLKMLCHPNAENTLETLIFLVARHMIIEHTTPIENLISVFTIVVLVSVRRYLKHDKLNEVNIEKLFHKSKENEDRLVKAASEAMEHVMGQVSGQMVDQVVDHVADQVADQLADQVADQVADQLVDHVADQVADQLVDHVADQLADQLAEQGPGIEE